MALITFSVIIAAPELREEIPCWQSLRSNGFCPNETEPPAPAHSPLEVLIVSGQNPSAQRNAAVREAKGTWLVFLDSDCEIAPDYFKKLDEIIRCERPDVVGGPALLKEPASGKELLFQELLAHPGVTGPSAARYAPRGERRESSERELILCNLAIRKECWDQRGEFNERLFPNEENEWMERVAQVDGLLVYDPELSIHRPQRQSWEEMWKTFIRYGKGRAKQSVVSHRWDAVRFFPLAGIIGVLLIIYVHGWLRGLAMALLGTIALSAWIYWHPERQSGKFRMLIALGAPGLIFAYGWGEGLGLIQSLLFGTKAKECPIEVKRYFPAA